MKVFPFIASMNLHYGSSHVYFLAFAGFSVAGGYFKETGESGHSEKHLHCTFKAATDHRNLAGEFCVVAGEFSDP